MGALRPLAAALLVIFAGRAGARPLDRWAAYVEEASERFSIPESWIRRVIEAESGGRTSIDGHPVGSRAGAMGLMQLMPGTWFELSSRLGLGRDPDDPRDNILAGTSYLRILYDRFGYPGLFAAYNAGPRRYADYLARRRPLPDETIAYLALVGGTPWMERGVDQMPRAPIFMVRYEERRSSQPPDPAAAPRADRLFVALRRP